MKLPPNPRSYIASFLWVAVMMFFASGARGAEADLDGAAQALDQGVTTREDRVALFTKFRIPTTPPFGALSPGQALLLWSLCGDNSICRDRALADRQAHKGWGEVARDLKAKQLLTDDRLSQAVRQATEAHRDLAARADRGLGGAASSGRLERPVGGMDRGRR